MNHDGQRDQPAEDERGALPDPARGREDKDERGERNRLERDHQADENKVQDDHVRPDLLAGAALRSVFTEGKSLSGFTEGKSLSGQRGISAGGNFSPGPVPGSSPAPGALLIELPRPRCLLDLIFFSLAVPGLKLPVLRRRRRPRCRVPAART
jgi:hypothetical protein